MGVRRYCARLLAHTGADVVVGEPPEGSRLRQARVVDTDDGPISAAWEYLRANTASIVVGPGRRWLGWPAIFDVVVLDEQGDLTSARAEIAAARADAPPAGCSSHHAAMASPDRSRRGERVRSNTGHWAGT